MSKSNITNYKLKSISEESYKLEEAKLSNTAFKITLKNCQEIAWKDSDWVETSDGRKFYAAQRSDGDGGLMAEDNGKITYYNTFNLTDYDATDTLVVHLHKENGDEIRIELVK